MQLELSEGFIRFLFAFGGVLAGWAIGFFDSKMRADKKIQQAEEKAQTDIQQAKGEAERAVMAAQAALEAASAQPTGATLLRLWLDAAERPALDLDGRRVDTAPISESNRKRLLALLTVMRPWIEGRPAAPSPAPAPAAPPASSSAPAAPRPLTPPTPKPAPAPAPAAGPVPAAAKEEKPAAPVSIVGQIDEILQARLAASPLANRAIRLQESPEGGVIVWVGLQKFAGVDEVTDPEVQSAIRDAIAEWERKYTPGV